MEMMIIPPYIDVFVSVLRDNQIAQVALITVCCLILCDWIFGIANALQHKEFSSNVMRDGLYHKAAEIGMLVVGVLLDGSLLGGFDIGYGAPVFTVLCGYIALMELGSLLEIFVRMNPDLEKSGVFQLLASVKVEEE